MKIKQVFLPALVLWLLPLVSCSQEEQLFDKVETAKTNRINAMIEDMYQRLHPGSRASDDGFHILNVETQRYDVHDSAATRAGDETESYEIHTVSIDFGESTGYAVLSDTPGVNHIFYYTEAGCIGDTATIEPLKEMIESVPKLAEEIKKEGYEKTTVMGTRAVLTIDPLVKFQWHQNYPFNFYATYCTCAKCSTRGNHMPAGCVPIAVAQTIATLKHFKGTFYGNKSIDFDKLPKIVTPFDYVDANTELTLGHFLQEIALNCQVKYGCDGTGTTLDPVAYYLRDIGYSTDLINGSLDKERYIRYLQAGWPHIMTGHRSNGVGHAWILDGAIETDNTILYHINWGHGPKQSDGWSSECYYGLGEESDYNYPNSHRHLYLTL